MRKGIFITLEGPEGGGKSTQLRLLARSLRRAGYPVVVTREPGGTPLSQHLRKWLLHTPHPLSPLAELLLYEADRAQHVDEFILPALKRRRLVLCDRFYDSTLAYQGYGRRLALPMIRTLNHIASRARMPDLTILLDIPTEKGLLRAAASKNGKDRMEKVGLSFHQRVRRGFLALAAREPRRFRVVSQQRDIADTHQRIVNIVERYLHDPTTSFLLARRRRAPVGQRPTISRQKSGDWQRKEVVG